jgi:hypothetical protein
MDCSVCARVCCQGPHGRRSQEKECLVGALVEIPQLIHDLVQELGIAGGKECTPTGIVQLGRVAATVENISSLAYLERLIDLAEDAGDAGNMTA